MTHRGERTIALPVRRRRFEGVTAFALVLLGLLVVGPASARLLVPRTDPGKTCRTILAANPSATDGVYTLQEPGGGPTYSAYCDMTTDGGGWTAVFAGQNGSPNVFDHFDTGYYAGTFTAPATHYLRRATNPYGAADLAVSCGGAMVAFALTEPARAWLTSGTQAGWLFLTPRLLAGVVPSLPNGVYSGSATDRSFIFATNQTSGANTFASSYDGNTSFDYCNGVADTASLVRVFYREAPLLPVLNAQVDAKTSCRAILDASQSLGDGVYWLQQSPNPAYQAYCDMTTDGGGWTAAFAGRNGSVNAFDRFDQGVYVGTEIDPATRYLRRAPDPQAAAELAASCGNAMVAFALTEPVRRWLTTGQQSSWAQLTPRLLTGSVANLPNSLWTGSGSDRSFIFAKDQQAFGNTFASSRTGSTIFDYCNGAFEQASLVRVFYREVAPTPVKNTAATAGTSCRAILDGGGATGDGIYWLQQPPDPAYKAFCDMTTDGGGWTAVFAGRNGSPNVFDHFDTGYYTGTTADPASRYLRRTAQPPSAADLAVSCGGAMVKFPLTEPVRAWLSGGQLADWQRITPTVLTGTVANPPNTFFTGSGTNRSFILAQDQNAFAGTFASSYDATANFDYCNGVFDQASLVRVFYREVAPTPVLNTPAQARPSCRSLHDGGALVDGIYWLSQAGGNYQAYCDMTTDGGGWTALFAGRNGSVNVFDHFDNGFYAGTFVDPATRYLRRAPTWLMDGDIAASCGAAMVKFPLTAAVRNFLADGQIADWQLLTPTVLSGTVANVPNTVWTGAGTNRSFIFARDQGAFGNTFAASYSANTMFDYCNGVFDQASFLRIFFRELTPTAVTVSSFAVRGRIVAWRTRSEAGILGFELWRDGRKLPGGLIRAKGALHGAFYRIVERSSHRGSVYRLQVVRLDGVRAWVASTRSR